MTLSQVAIMCPHCGREHRVSLDLGRLARVTSRAVCSRCNTAFEITPERIGSAKLRIPVERQRRTKHDVREVVRPQAGRRADDGSARTETKSPDLASRDHEQPNRGELTVELPRTRSARTKTLDRPPVTAPAMPLPPVVPDEPVLEPDTDWLVRARPGLDSLITPASEGAAALAWLLERPPHEADPDTPSN